MRKENDERTVKARNITEGAKRKIDSVQVTLEKELLYPLLRGRDISRWHTETRAHILFLQDVQKRRGISEDALRTLPWTLKWLKSHENLLAQRAAYKRYFKPDKDPYYSI